MTTALIVDDSRVVRKVARRILESLKFECREAEDGQFACDSCKESMPDMILLDWNMPNMTGIEFLIELRTNIPGGDKPKVIFCTTENNMDHIQQAMQAGANEYIMKPFDNDIIKFKLETVGVLSSSV